MLLNFFDFFFTLSRDKPIWVDFIQISIPLLLFIWGFLRAFNAWERQKKREIELGLEQKRYESKIEACKEIWSLLAYLSQWENDKVVFLRREKKYYFRKKQGIEFIQKLQETFFEKGYGVFMPKDVLSNLYHFRGIVYKMADKMTHDHPSEETMEVTNPEIEKTIADDFEKIRSSLKNMLHDSKIEFKED